MENFDFEKTIDRVTNLINSISEPRRTKINKMFEEIGEFYFTAPASSKEAYHYSFDGGLAAHSLNVYDNLRKLNESFDLKFTPESMIISCLFHDLGKAVTTTCDGPNYVPEDKWHRDRGMNYKISDNGEYFPNHQKSMFILQKFGVELTDQEYQAILLNDGMYIDANRAYSHKQCELSLYLHIADIMACYQEKGKK